VYDSPGELERAIAHFVEYYNHRRLHESLQNVTPADAYTKRQAAILDPRARITRRRLARRTRENLSAA
jgi:putative transposase